ncbi:VTT domain-containing protein [Candidatus Nomurabacteria bacterium]|nr:VTT domain-containing protein [Candidatus Nomurabacteria bacterium]
MSDISGTEQIINQLGALSYGGIWVVSFFSNIVIPVPEELILLALGYLSGTGSINGVLVMPIVISALLVNDIILYKLSKRGSKITNYLYKTFFEKRLAKRDDKWLEMNIGSIIFFSRFLVQLRFIGPFLAGSRNIPIRKFVIYDLLALLVYVPIFIGLGWYFHNRLSLVVDNVNVVKNIILMTVGVVLIYSPIRFVYKLIFRKS